LTEQAKGGAGVKKSELKANTDFSIFSIDKKYWETRSGIWREYIEDMYTTVDDALKFLAWYLDDTDDECPFSATELRKTADRLVSLACVGTDVHWREHREDYRAIFRFANYSVLGGIMTSELVRLMDFTAERLSDEAEPHREPHGVLSESGSGSENSQ
jgi:hypothetical protein